jgi:osmoprotectant transport system permease protein
LAALITRNVSFVAVCIGVLPLLGAGFVTFRPNRIAAGETLTLWGAAGANSYILVFIVGALLLLACTRVIDKGDKNGGDENGVGKPGGGRVATFLLSWGASLTVVVLLFLAGRVAAETAAEVGSIARISIGPALWLALVALPLILIDTFSRLEPGMRRERIILVAGAAVGAVGVAALFAGGGLDQLSIMREYANRTARFYGEFCTHLALSGTAVLLACLLGLPLGVLAHRRARFEGPTFFLLNILQTVPSLALFSILIPLLAALIAAFPALGAAGVSPIGGSPALIALTAYSLLPIVRNTHTGFKAVDPAIVDAGAGMGMTRTQLLWQIELPIASPIILGGVRIALVQAIGLTAVAALIGAGGFGVFIFQGLGQAAEDLILLGALPTVAIAVVADTLMQALIALARPKGLR